MRSSTEYAPDYVDDKQLAELGIEVTPEAEAEIEAEKSAPVDAE